MNTQKESGNTIERSKTQKYCTETFLKIPESKKDRILNAAISEFAKNGYQAANINVIAKKAGISIGSMYNYFNSKEALFLEINDIGYRIIKTVYKGINDKKGDFFDKFEKMIKSVQLYSRKYPELTQMYQEITSEGLSHLSKNITRKIEDIALEFYTNAIIKGQKEGTLTANADPNMTAFFLDNLIILLQYSYTSEYFKERMKIFIGEDALENDEKIANGLMAFVRRSLAP
ncbi:MAG: TetR/AcrR family transcriptional regulator [Proteobacteria bacterium]|nr:TetR/AcrR family transcriptional regulator [Pseudomonadota bacterium]